MYLLLLSHFLYITICYSISIDDFGAIPNEDSLIVSIKNANALKIGLEYINKHFTINELIIPKNTYYLHQVEVEYLSNITVLLHGNIVMNNDIKSWGDIKGKAMITFSYCKHISIIGNGGNSDSGEHLNSNITSGIQSHHSALKYQHSVIDGQGLLWWRLSYIGHELRPRLLEFQYSHDITIQYISILNSPSMWIVILNV